MAINVSCPSCGAKRILSDAFRGLSVLCPKCGTRFTATGSSDSTFFSLTSGKSLGSEEGQAGGAEGPSSGSLDPVLIRDLLGTATLSSSGSTEVPAMSSDEQPAAAPAFAAEPPTRLPGGPPPAARKEHVLPPVETERPPARASESQSALGLGGLGQAASPASAKTEYKVLTRDKLWFSGEFNPAGLEEALNSYAQQGWKLKSTEVLTITGPEGPREEFVVILER